MLEFLLGAGGYALRHSSPATWAGGVTDRRLRLFACACFHRVRDLLPHPLARAAVDVAERFADGHAAASDLETRIPQ
jgi:hypothetical protein